MAKTIEERIKALQAKQELEKKKTDAKKMIADGRKLLESLRKKK